MDFWKNKKKKSQLILGILISLFIIILFKFNLFSYLDAKVQDFFFNIRPPLSCNEQIVIVSIDDPSLKALGKFPWKTSVHAKLVDILANQKPKVICFDILFDKPDENPNNDKLFAQSIKKAGNVFLAMGFTAQERPSSYFKKEPTVALNITQAQFPISILERSARGCGFTNIFPSHDAINRKIHLIFPFGDKFYLSFATLIAADLLKIKPQDISFSDPYLKLGDKLDIFLDQDKQAIINYYGKPGTFHYIPYIEVLNKNMPADYFKDKIVLIGGVVSGLWDLWPTPISHAMPGVEIQTTVLNNLLDNKFLKKNNFWKDIIIFFIIGIALGITTPILSPLKNALFAFILWLGLTVFSYYQFISHLYILPTASIFVAISFSFIAQTVFFLIFEESEKKIISEEKEKFYELAIVDGLTQLYVSRYFRQCLTEELAKATQENHYVSLIMLDLDDFKKVNDTYGHEQGNIVLYETAQIIKKNLRDGIDIAGRYGGEEMAIILPKTGPEIACKVAERIRTEMAAHKYSGFKGFKQITASFGVATFPKHGQTEDDLINQSDNSLYKSKEAGKNRVTLAG